MLQKERETKGATKLYQIKNRKIMSDPNQTVFSPAHKIRITKWKVREGFQVNSNQVILLYELPDSDGGGGGGDGDGTDKEIKRFKSTKCGIVKRRHFTEGAIVDVK